MKRPNCYVNISPLLRFQNLRAFSVNAEVGWFNLKASCHPQKRKESRAESPPGGNKRSGEGARSKARS